LLTLKHTRSLVRSLARIYDKLLYYESYNFHTMSTILNFEFYELILRILFFKLYVFNEGNYLTYIQSILHIRWFDPYPSHLQVPVLTCRHICRWYKNWYIKPLYR